MGIFKGRAISGGRGMLLYTGDHLYVRTRDARGALKAGSALVELLVVIGIIAVLLSILLPTINRARESAKRTQCLSNLRSIYQMMVIYSFQNNG